MKNVLFLVFLALFSSCKKTESQKPISLSKAIPKKIVQDTIAYFENALTYQYEQNGEKQELWIYVNESKKELLFVPNDDMIQAVISYPNGNYSIYGTDENGKKVVLKQSVSAIASKEIKQDILKKVRETRIISQKNIQQKDISCAGFRLNYIKMEGGETLYATTQIPINSFQLYGFSRLEGDCKLPLNIDFINVFNKNQLLTHIERDNFKLELLNYGPNPYEFRLKEYLTK